MQAAEPTLQQLALSLLFTQSHKRQHQPFLSLSLLLLPSTFSHSVLLVLSTSVHNLAGASPRPDSIEQFHTCLLHWHLSERVFSPPWYYFALPPQQYHCLFNLPDASCSSGGGSKIRSRSVIANFLFSFNLKFGPSDWPRRRAGRKVCAAK